MIALSLTGIVAAIALIILAPSLATDSPTVAELIRLSALAAVPTVVLWALRGTAQGLHQWSSLNMEKAITGIARLSGIAGLALFQALTVQGAFVVMVGAPILGYLAYIKMLSGLKPEHPKQSGLRLLRQMSSFGSKVWLGSIAGILITRLDQVLILPLSSAEQLGLYASAVNVGDIPFFLTAAFGSIILARESAGASNSRVGFASRVLFAVVFVVTSVVALTCNLWFTLLFGPAFADGVGTAVVLLVAALLSAPGTIAGSTLTGRGHPHDRSLALAAGADYKRRDVSRPSSAVWRVWRGSRHTMWDPRRDDGKPFPIMETTGNPAWEHDHPARADLRRLAEEFAAARRQFSFARYIKSEKWAVRMSGVLVHEWLGQTGGSEKVLDVFAGMYTDADIYCLWDDTGRYGDRNLHESVLARTALRTSKALALPLMPMVWRQMKSVESYDWMLVSSHLFAHHARFAGRNAGIPKYVYTHTPARYIWEPDLDKRGNNIALRSISRGFQILDRARAKEPLSIAANSKFVAHRIERCWNRESKVIYPPVEVSRIQAVQDWSDGLPLDENGQLSQLPHEFVLGASRFVGYKRLETVIRAAELVGLPAVIAGSGPDEIILRERASRASVPVHVILRPSDQMLYALYQRCSVYVFPPVEDFGIMPVEAMAAGAPVVANRCGGTSETVINGLSGYLADMDDEQDLKFAVEQSLALDRTEIPPTSSRFSTERFRQQVAEWIPEDSLTPKTFAERG